MLNNQCNEFKTSSFSEEESQSHKEAEMKKTLTLIIGLAVVLMGALTAQAADTVNVNMTVNLKAWYDLSITKTTVTFADQQPDISATPGTKSLNGDGAVAVRAFAVTGSGNTLKLNVTAADDLKDGGKTIGIGAISWTASGIGFAAGTMAKTAVEAGSWGSAVLHWHEGSFTFSFLRNYATQEPGDYSATATYTLSVI